jgi:anti-sigma factor RsiW
MRCQTARRWITTDLAGELPAGRVRRLSRHVERCEGCRRERTAYTALDRLLGELPLEASPSPRLEQDTLRRVRLAAAGDDAAEGGPWAWLKVGAPALAGAAVLLLAVRAVSPPAAPDAPTGHATPRAASGTGHVTPAPVGGQTASRRRTAGTVPSEPPAELAARPDLFVNLPVLRNMEKLQHYEAIQTTTLDEQHDGQSSG